MPRDLNELEVLARLAQRASFEVAARDLGVSPSTVSRKLAGLETRLGVALVQRTTRSVRMTPAGLAYAEHCREMCAAADRAEASIAQHRKGFSGDLSVNAPTLFGRTVLAPVLFAFALRHPGVRLRVVLNNRRVDPVMEGFDIVFRIGPLTDSGLRARKLADARQAVVASPAVIALHGRPASFAEVAARPCISFARGEDLRWTNGVVDGIAVDTVFAADDLDLAREAAIAGLGFALLPGFIVDGAIRDGRLVELELADTIGSSPVTAIFPGHDIPNPCARALVDDMAAALARDPAWRVG